MRDVKAVAKEGLSAAFLAALQISGDDWEMVVSLGGVDEVVINQSKLFSLIKARYLRFQKKNRRLLTNEQIVIDCLPKAFAHLEVVYRFKKSGGLIIGAESSAELGRIIRAPKKPFVAFLRGDAALVQQNNWIAIVGTRTPSQNGAKRAYRIGFELAKSGYHIVSGGANGVDMNAHQGAIDAGGKTLCILGEPLLNMGDERPGRLRRLVEQGMTTLTPFGPWSGRGDWQYVYRNQFVAAIAQAVIIVEGKRRSGTLHTAEFADKMNIPVWAVPGCISDPLAAGPNSLIESQKARAYLATPLFLNQPLSTNICHTQFQFVFDQNAQIPFARQ